MVTLVPSAETSALENVGRTPSTLCPVSAATASWVRKASFSAASLMVTSSRVILFPPMAIPSASLSPSFRKERS